MPKLTTMTDLEAFIALYARFGVDVKVVPRDEGGSLVRLGEGFATDDVTKHESFDGYTGFFTDVTFDADGKYVSQGFWE